MNMDIQSLTIRLQYPPSLRPGDSRFFKNGLRVGPFRGRIGIDVRIPDVRICAYDRSSPNFFKFKGSRREQVLGLTCEAKNSASVGARQEIGIYVYRYKTLWYRLFFFIGLVLLLLIPSIVELFRLTFLRVSLSIGNVIVIGLPLFFLLGLYFTGRKTAHILRIMLNYDVFVAKPLHAFGAMASITFNAIDTPPCYEQDVFEGTVVIAPLRKRKAEIFRRLSQILCKNRFLFSFLRIGQNEYLKIVGKMSGDYFQIQCEDCGSSTKNVYRGWDPSVPFFTATCEKCGKKSTWKLALWEGLPPQP